MNDLDSILSCAMYYQSGRMSYIRKSYNDWPKEYGSKLSSKQFRMYKEEIEKSRQEKEKYCGM